MEADGGHFDLRLKTYDYWVLNYDFWLLRYELWLLSYDLYNLDDKIKRLSVTFSFIYSANDRLIFIVLFPRKKVCMKSKTNIQEKK